MTRAVRHLAPWFVLPLAALFGCVDPGSGPNESTSTSALVWVPQQGRLVQGFKPTDVRWFDFSGSLPATKVVEHGQLVAGAVTGTSFKNVKFNGADGATTFSMRIAEVIPPVAPAVQWQYVLEQDTGNGWESACQDPAPLVPALEPLETPIRAIALPGMWWGPYFWSNPNLVTFSCKTGVAAKCDGWGFGLSQSWPQYTKNGYLHWASSEDMMQTCTQMARADYCAAGMPNTFEGTPIQISDAFYSSPPEPIEGYAFEAAWNGTAISDGHPLQPTPVVCLSKLRWSTLPLGGNCPGALDDPRVTDKAHFCEDLAAVPGRLEERGALMYSASAFLDAGLYSYVDKDNRKHLTTASLLPGAVNKPYEWTIPPPADVPFPSEGQTPPQFEATIFAAKLPVTIPDVTLAKLFSYNCGSDFVTTTRDDLDPGCKLIAHEGYVYPPNTPGRAPLRRWFNPGLKSSITTPKSPTQMIAAGWEHTEVVGGVLRAELDVNLRWGWLAGYTYTVDARTTAGGWITSCLANLTTTSFAFHGRCPGAGDVVLNHSNVVEWQITATRAGMETYVANVAYDGFSSDVYFPIGGKDALISALTVSWNALGADYVYGFDVRIGDTWKKCVGPRSIGNATSYTHTGRCWLDRSSATPSRLDAARVCAYRPGREDPISCGEAKLTGWLSAVKVVLK